MNLSIIVITFNSKKYIEDCIKHILLNLEDSSDCEIIVYDNNSKDNTIELIRGLNSNLIKVISSKSNLGYSKAINSCMLESQFENIMILNPDAIMKPDTISKLLEALSFEDVGVVGPKVLNDDGSFQLSSRRHFPTFGVMFSYFFLLNKIFPKNKFFGKYNYTFIDENNLTDVDAVSGACMMFRKTIYSNLRGFDESFFMYFEDTDFCVRVKSLGYRVIYYPEAEVLHLNDYMDNYDIKIVSFYKSLERFIEKHKSKIYFSFLISIAAKIIRHFSYIKRIIYLKYNYKTNNE